MPRCMSSNREPSNAESHRSCWPRPARWFSAGRATQRRGARAGFLDASRHPRRMSDWSRTVLHLGGRAVDALPPRWRSSVRSALMRPEPRSVTLDELDAVLDRATALMGPAPDEARALLDGIVLALPTAPPDDPFSDAYREWTWELYRTISGRAAYDTAHEASPFDLAAARQRPFPYQTGSLALVGRDLLARGHRVGVPRRGGGAGQGRSRGQPPVTPGASSNSARAGAT